MDKKISVIIPAHNEEKAIKKVIELVKDNKIIDEIIVVDNCSCDNTTKISIKAGAKVINCNKQGKGHAMELGIKEAKGEFLVFLDGDIVNYDKKIIENLTRPLMKNEADFVKARFDRAEGRVTKLVAKPLLSLLFEELNEFEQPLGGFIAGRKSDFSKLNLEKDYGVDIGILIDMFNMNVRIKQVNVGKIKNDSKSWEGLEGMSKEVIATILRKANCIK